MSAELKDPKTMNPNKTIIVAMGKIELTRRAFFLLTAPIAEQLMQMPITKNATEIIKSFSITLCLTCPMLITVGTNFRVP
jgi:hypothetical protein